MRVVVAGFALLVATVLVAAISFIVTPAEPFGYYKDLGFNWEVIDWVVHRVRSPIDAFDTIGWSPWTFGPLFYLNSYLGDLAGVVVSWIVGNSWLAVKIVEVLQTIVAAAGAYAMYATASRSRTWRAIFACLYAALPATMLTIRWNEDFGWIVALAPGVLAASRALIRRFGARAIPLVGLLAALAGYLIAIQFLIFTSLPIFAIALAAERKRLSSPRAVALIPLGIAACVAIGAFFVVPSFVHPLLTDSATRSESLHENAFFGDFSLDWIGLLTLVEREWAASPIPQFDVASHLPILVVPMALVWIAAVTHLATARDRARTWADPISTAIVGICIVLSLGASLPFGRELWSALYAIPHVDGIRTVDRLFALPPLFITFWAVCACERFSLRRRRFRIGSAAALLAITFACVVFDRIESAFTVEYSKGVREPQLDAVRAVTERDGERIAAFASVNGGASEDAPTYGRPQPVGWSTTDLGSRFIDDGVGASGVLGRSGVGEVVTSPSWTYDQPTLPDASNVYRTIPHAARRFASPDGVYVWSIPHRADVSAVRIACVRGGPGAFDLLDADDAFATAAFATDAGTCDRDGFVDYDPLDAWSLGRPIDAIAGRDLGLGGDALRDADYHVFYNRTLLNVPWYRNAVDGDRPAFVADGAARVVRDANGRVPVHHAWPAGTTLAFRIAAHAPARVTVSAGDTILGDIAVEPALGFRWYRMRVGVAVDAAAPVRLALRTTIPARGFGAWPGVAIDGLLAFASDASATQTAVPREPFVVASLKRFVATDDRLRDRADVVLDSPISLASFAREPAGSGPTFVATGALATARFRFTGTAGTYVVRASASLETTDATIGIGAGGSCCDAVASHTVLANRGVPTTVAARLSLATGSIVVVQIAAPRFAPHDGNRLIDVRAIPDDPIVLGTTDTDPGTTTIGFENDARALARLAEAPGVRFADDGLHGRAGSRAVLHVDVLGRPRSVVATIASAGGEAESGLATLDCGTRRSTVRLLGIDDAGVADANGFDRCTLTLTWTGSQMLIANVRLSIAGAEHEPTRASIWIPAGRFAFALRAANGLADVTTRPVIAGCGARAATCAFARAGVHDVTLPAHRADDALLVLRAPSISAPPAIHVREDGALRWTVTVDARTDVALTQMNDGNWTMSDGTRSIAPRSCDIVDTCFAHVPPGTYRIVHRWSNELIFGTIVSLLTLVAAIGALVRPARPRPRRDAA